MSKRGLLNFSIDHLTLNVGFDEYVTPEQVNKTNIFKLAHFLKYSGLNDTNTNQLLDLFWEPFGEEVNISKENSNQKHNTYAIYWGKYKILRLEDVDKSSTLKSNLNYKYQYRVTFYGTLFALSRIQKINLMDFLRPFYEDLSHSFMIHSVSRLDICADIFGASVSSIRRGIKGDKTHFKNFSKINENAVSKEAETIYYGKKSGAWMARIYNKLLDINAKGKELLFIDYLSHAKVTRLEIELKSAVIQRFKVDLFNVFDLSYLLSVYKQTLKNKYVEFSIVSFIEKEMIKSGTASFQITPKKLTYDPLSRTKVFKRFNNNVKKLFIEYEVSPKLLIDSINRLARDNPN